MYDKKQRVAVNNIVIIVIKARSIGRLYNIVINSYPLFLDVVACFETARPLIIRPNIV